MEWEKWKRKDFEKLPYAKWDKEIICQSFIIIPSKRIHESGYRVMTFVAIKDGKPLCKLGGGADVLHFEGIGGYGYKWVYKEPKPPTSLPIRGWSMDCLSKSGLFRIFVYGCDIVCGPSLSSFEIFSKEKV